MLVEPHSICAGTCVTIDLDNQAEAKSVACESAPLTTGDWVNRVFEFETFPP